MQCMRLLRKQQGVNEVGNRCVINTFAGASVVNPASSSNDLKQNDVTENEAGSLTNLDYKGATVHLARHELVSGGSNDGGKPRHDTRLTVTALR